MTLMQNLFKSNLVRFLTSENSEQLKKMTLMSVLVGIANTLLISLVNMAANNVLNDKSTTLEFFGYVLLLIVFLIFTKKANNENIKNANQFIYLFKVRVMSQAFNSSLLKIDKVGRDYILEVLNRDTQMVSQSVFALLSGFQSFATVFFLTLYLATVSLWACLIILLSAIFIFILATIELTKLTQAMQAVILKENEVNAFYAAFLSGYKEVKMNSHRAYDLTREMLEKARAVTEEKTGMVLNVMQFFTYLQMMLYLVVGSIVFVVPLFSSDFSSHVLAATTTALFLASALSSVIQSVPTLSLANVAAHTLQELERKLDGEADERVMSGVTQFEQVQTLTLKDVTYVHPKNGANQPFMMGPINYEFDAGKVYFIRGNNGSGKTTLIRVLLGLYQCERGLILVNGKPIAEPATSDYRDLFAVVFSDFYLFEKLYGVIQPNAAEANKLLEEFEMQDKVSIKDGAFSTTKLSTGQRKRLGLIVALLEEKNFIVLDEWAADQDPEFRRDFYEKIIPRLRALGKTVIAITHDDQYYDLADHVIYMENGQSVHQHL